MSSVYDGCVLLQCQVIMFMCDVDMLKVTVSRVSDLGMTL